MRSALRFRTPNPHLGAYLGIITSAFISLSILLALLEQMGWSEAAIAPILILAPVVLAVVIAVRVRTETPEDYFACGRRVPAFYNGVAMAATLIGGIGFFAYAGAVFFLGFDGLAIGLGWSFGMLAGTVLFSGYLRKSGAYTVPSFLGHRFQSTTVRLTAACLLLVPVILLLAAEMKIVGVIAALFLPIPYWICVLVAGAVIAAIVILGGLRALTWTGNAQFVIGAVAFAVPLVIVSVLLTVLPTPQLTYGERFDPLTRAEINAGIMSKVPSGISDALPGDAPQASDKPFAQSFGAIGSGGFFLLFLAVALGTAALPSVLIRSGATLSVAEQRFAGAWAVLFVALFVISVPAAALFAKVIMFHGLSQIDPNTLPNWMNQLVARGLLIAQDANSSGGLQASELLILRDGVMVSLPILSRLPLVCAVIVAAGGISVALAAAGAHLFTLGASLADDIYQLADQRIRPESRFIDLPHHIIVWGVMGTLSFATALFLAVIGDIDVLQAALTALAFLGATFFPVLLLSIWWERFTRSGALFAMATGCGTMVIELLFRGALEDGQVGTATALASVIGALLATGAGVAVSLWDTPPSAAELGYFDALRDPDGESIYDEAKARIQAAAASGNGARS
ncbi:hypothetical protein V6C03_06325 [Methyloligella sp. 2.7D]|uniref:sodium:solute symporter family transporter n=1 Tax=unclassified Methyloligella TaxID=2625955 RepID=UPI001FF07B9F|nr:hypothetical protein [Methyloligella sp. GL2]